MLERQKPFEPVEMVFHEEMDLRDPIATGKHGQQAHGNDFGQIVHRSVSGPRILDGFKYHQHAVHLGHHCSSLVTMHLGIRLERAWGLASCPPWVFALSRDEISNEKALGELRWCSAWIAEACYGEHSSRARSTRWCSSSPTGCAGFPTISWREPRTHSIEL